MKKMIKSAGSFLRKHVSAFVVGAGLLVGANANAAVDTTTFDTVVTDCGTWIAYGVTTFITLLGTGLTIVAASWVYRKVKRAISAN